jgi:hypothetical protein
MGLMRRAKPVAVLCAVALAGVGCSAMQGKQARKDTPRPHVSTETPTPVPTVPPQAPTPAANVPLPTRPIRSEDTDAARKAGKLVGPVVTHLGIARADGTKIEPIATQKDGTAVYQNAVGSGFILIVEGKPGISNIEVGRRVIARDSDNPKARPDLEIQTNKDLGDASARVCDKRRPDIGGVPAINPPSFADTKKVADTMNDLACRFEVFIESASACTVTKSGEFAFLNDESRVQFCMIVARAWNFPSGDTLVSVRLRDKEGNPGPSKTMILRRAELPRTVDRKPAPTKTPTPSRRRP